METENKPTCICCGKEVEVEGLCSECAAFFNSQCQNEGEGIDAKPEE